MPRYILTVLLLASPIASANGPGDPVVGNFCVNARVYIRGDSGGSSGNIEYMEGMLLVRAIKGFAWKNFGNGHSFVNFEPNSQFEATHPATSYGFWPASEDEDGTASASLLVNMDELDGPDPGNHTEDTYCRPMTESQYRIMQERVSHMQKGGERWSETNNCTTFVDKIYTRIYGESIDTGNIVTLRIPAPKFLQQWIRKKNKNNPEGQTEPAPTRSEIRPYDDNNAEQ